jgi:hypothetical protein
MEWVGSVEAPGDGWPDIDLLKPSKSPEALVPAIISVIAMVPRIPTSMVRL